jgi:uncharacterized membrane protein
MPSPSALKNANNGQVLSSDSSLNAASLLKVCARTSLTRSEPKSFSAVGVWDTEDNNGVLIYLNLSDRAIEIYLDRGAAREVTQTQLDDIVKQMEIAFADKKFEEGACQAFRSLAAILSKPFPNKPVQDPVPNTPVVL